MQETSRIEEEIWKDVPGYEGRYQASTLGRVKSLDKPLKNPKEGRSVFKGRVLKCHTAKNKYVFVMFGDRITRNVHRIIAQTFLPNPENKPTVNHKDGNPSNNHLSNLEWATWSENECHARDVLKKDYSKPCKGVKSFRAMPVACYNIKGDLIAVYGSIREAARITKMSLVNIRMLAHNKIIKPSKLIFKFITKPEYYKMKEAIENGKFQKTRVA